MKLAELSQGWEMFEAAIEAEGGELTEALAQRFDFLNLSEREKVDGYVWYTKALEGDEKKLIALAEEILAKAKTKLARRQWLLSRLKDYMALRGTAELQGEIYKAKLVKSGKRPVVVIAPLNSLPPDWVKVERKPVLDTIRAALESQGNEDTLSSLARLGEPTISLRIY